MFLAPVNEDSELRVSDSKDSSAGVAKYVNNTCFHVKLANGIEHKAYATGIDKATNQLTSKINHVSYNVALSTPAEQLVQALRIVLPKPQLNTTLKSPMPGMILKILVKKGDDVQKGTGLALLQARKIENVFKAFGNAIISHVLVQKGQAV